MEGNGPILGTSKTVGVIVAGTHPPSVDATCCQIMGINPEKIRYLRLTEEKSGWNWKTIVQTGEKISEFHSPFALHPDLRHLLL